MELGDGRIGWFLFVPRFNGNKDLPEEDRISMEIRKLRGVDICAMSDSPGALEAWRDEVLDEWLKHPEYGEKIKRFPPNVLNGMRQFVENSRNWHNVVFDGKRATDPVEIFLLLSSTDLVVEVNTAITTASQLYGDRLKNFVRACAGPGAGTSSRTGESTAPPVSSGSNPSGEG